MPDRQAFGNPIESHGCLPDFSPLDAHALFGDEDLVADAEAVGLCQQAFDGFVVGFIS